MASLEIIPYSSKHKKDFKRINVEWLEDMFYVEDYDLEVLSHPEKYILSKGGIILLARLNDEVVGTSALMPHRPGEVEFTKMGVSKKARGSGAGKALLEASLKTATELKATKLFLLTNKRCKAAIHLYRKYGFVDSLEIQRQYGSSYKRCDLGMLFLPEKQGFA